MAALFKSANAAVKFAVNYSNSVRLPRSDVSKIADPPKAGINSGLSGLDGAGQAGMILSMISSLGKLHEACLFARCAPQKISCSCGATCCSKFRPNWCWYEAINCLSLSVKEQLELERKEGTRGVQDNPAMRQALVAKFFGERIKIKDLAAACDVTGVTASTHNGKINKILKHAEAEAWHLIEDTFRVRGGTEIID
jgi:hypothetical protein